ARRLGRRQLRLPGGGLLRPGAAVLDGEGGRGPPDRVAPPGAGGRLGRPPGGLGGAGGGVQEGFRVVDVISACQRAGLVRSEESAADLGLSAWSCARAGVAMMSASVRSLLAEVESGRERKGRVGRSGDNT